MLLNLDTRWGKNYPVTGVERPLRVQEVEASRIFRQVAYEGGKVARYKLRPPLPPPHPREDPLYSFLLEAEKTGLTKNTNGPIGKIIRVFPACSAVPQTNYTTMYPIQVVPVAHGATKYCSLTAVIGRQPVFFTGWGDSSNSCTLRKRDSFSVYWIGFCMVPRAGRDTVEQMSLKVDDLCWWQNIRQLSG